ncbi:MAG: hypothetical protein ACK6DZ_13905, partial [Acidobacteriota bacterium]
MIHCIGLFLLITSALAAPPRTRTERNRALSALHAPRPRLQDAVAGRKGTHLTCTPHETSWS